MGRSPWLIASVLFVALKLLAPGAPLTAFEHDYDEGGNLMKAALVVDGAHLYSEIWSDQPPLFTWLLAGAMWIAGADVAVGRMLSLLFTALLIACGVRIVEREHGRRAAVIAAGLLPLVPRLWGFSTTVLIGLPAIALAVCAVDVATVRPTYARAVVGGMVLAAAVGTKAFVAPLGVGLVLALMWRREVGAALVLTATSASGVGALLIGLGPTALPLLVHPHLTAAATPLLGLSVGSALGPLAPLVTIAAGALPRVRATPGTLALALGALSSLAVLLVHTPRWYHHALLVGVPAALVAAIAIDAAWRRSRLRFLAALGVAAVLASALFSGQIEPLPASDVVAALVGAGARHVVTDRPMVAFRAGARVAPRLAVISAKRQTQEDIDRLLAECVGADNVDAVYVQRFDLPLTRAAVAGRPFEHVPVETGMLWLKPRR